MWGTHRLYLTRIRLLGCHRLAAQERQHFSGDVAGLHFRGEENVRGSDFFGLRGTLHRRLLSVLGNILGFLVGDIANDFACR